MSPINIHFVAFLAAFNEFFRFPRRNDDDDVKTAMKMKNWRLKLKNKSQIEAGTWSLFSCMLVCSNISCEVNSALFYSSSACHRFMKAYHSFTCDVLCVCSCARNFREQRDDEQRIENIKIENYMLLWNKKRGNYRFTYYFQSFFSSVSVPPSNTHPREMSKAV